MSDEWEGIPRGVRAAAVHAREHGAAAKVVRFVEMPGETRARVDLGLRQFDWNTPSPVRFWVPAKVQVTGEVAPNVAVALTLAGFRERDGKWVWDSRQRRAPSE